ncbi:Centrobin, partial [Ophiophagus hannah]
MAEKGLRRALSSSLHSDDLLSDMELLPASDPPTPRQQVPCSQLATPYTSKVTTQLYASLHQSRQAEAQASSRLEGQHGSALTRKAMDADVDLDTLAEELSHRLSASVEASAFRQGAVAESRHISEMENVRCHLQSMLRGSRDVPVTLESLEHKDDDSFESDSTGALLNARPLHDVSPPGSLASFEDLFPRYTSLRLGHFHNQVSQLDPRLLKDALEKEQARRKQQLAVAISADKRKDSMIEQLDKTLAKVVEGWNQQQAERTKMSELEGRLQQALSALHREQQLASQYCREKETLEKEKTTLSCSLEAERVRGQSLEAEWDLDRRQQDALRATLEEQQRTWVQREKQLEEQRQTAQEESRLHLEKEKREAQKALDAQQALSTVQAEMQGLQADLEAVRRERDTPVLHQQTKSQGGSEGPEKCLRDSSRPFLPLVPDVGRLSSEFSHILNSSLLSQQGFQQLDPQVDTTIAGSGLNFHPENLAEHPFADERDDSSPELAGNDSEVTQPSTGESGAQGPQPDLNYYMRLLLSHSDFEGSAPQQETCATDSPPRTMNRTQAGNSQSYHERSTALWDPAQPSFSTIRIQPPSSAAVHKTKVPLPKSGPVCLSLEPVSPSKQNVAHEEGILSPNHVAAVSLLLKQYQAKGRPVPSTEELYKYLHRIGQNGSETKGDGNLPARRNLDPKLSESMRKEGPPSRRAGSSGPGREKSHAPGKTGKKLSGSLASHSRSSSSSRGGSVWR